MSSILFKNFLIFIAFIGNVASLMVYAAPLPTVITVWRNRSISDVGAFPFLSTHFACCLWLYSSLLKDAFVETFIYGAGTAIYAGYTVVWMNFASKAYRITAGKILFLFCALGFIIFRTSRSLDNEFPRDTLLLWTAIMSELVAASPTVISLCTKCKGHASHVIPSWVIICGATGFVGGAIIPSVGIMIAGGINVLLGVGHYLVTPRQDLGSPLEDLRAQVRDKRQPMKTLPMYNFYEDDKQSGGVMVAMEVDNVELSLDIFGEGPVLDAHRLADFDFLHSFQDDFDDEDIN